MVYPYEHQAEAINLLSVGDYIFFSDTKGGGINSGTVKSIDRDNGTVVIENVNGETDETGAASDVELSLTAIFLYRDSLWDE